MMTYEEIYNMVEDDVIKVWNNWCYEHDHENLRVWDMSDWRREVAYKYTIPWFLDRLDPERFNPGHAFVAYDTCDDVWLSSDDVFELMDINWMIEEDEG